METRTRRTRILAAKAPPSEELPKIAALQRKTKIVATMGPACDDPTVMREVLAAGVDVARFNLSHGSHGEHSERLAKLRAAADGLGRRVGVLFDLQGPKIRTGRLKGGRPVRLETGSLVTIRYGDFEGGPDLLATGYEPLAEEVLKGQPILIDDGLIALRVEEVDGPDVKCRVEEGGLVRERKGMNLPEADVKAPAMTPKDREDALFAVESGADYVALSFVRKASDVEECRRFLESAGGNLPVVAKIEKPQAIDNLDAIVDAADGVMVARGDLGVEMSPESVPVLQKRIIRCANDRKKLVITATQMLESMIEKPRPTRAETADVANAIFDGSDAVMLSAETAHGAHPVQSVSMMARIALRAENSDFFEQTEAGVYDDVDDSEDLSIAHAAAIAYREYRAQAFVVYTLSGKTALLLSKMRPAIPIIALSSSPVTVGRLTLAFGVFPQLIEDAGDTDAMLAAGGDLVIRRGLLARGTKIIVLSGSQKVAGGTNMMQIKRV